MNERDDNPMPAEEREPVSLPPVVFGRIEIDEPVAEETPRPRPMAYRPRTNFHDHEPSSRELMLGWCFWLLGSWTILGMGIDGTPIRWMIFASAMGMMIAWPVYRLSQSGVKDIKAITRKVHEASAEAAHSVNARLTDATGSPLPVVSPSTTHSPLALAEDCQCHQPVHSHSLPSHLTPGLIFRDWFALNGVFQAVIWPHLLTGQWTFEQAGWVSGCVATWSLLVAAIVAWGCRFDAGFNRTMAMLIVLLLILGEPVVLALANELAEVLHQPDLDWPMSVSPIHALYALTAPPTDYAPGRWAVPVGCVLLVAVMAWTKLLMRENRRP